MKKDGSEQGKRYQIVKPKQVDKDLDRLDDLSVKRILSAIKDLAFNPRPQGFVKLKDRAGFRIRVGNYRIVYDILDEKLIVLLIAVGHRSDIYR